jgi:uncharacterized protein involved in tolerance to divalent cations
MNGRLAMEWIKRISTALGELWDECIKKGKEEKEDSTPMPPIINPADDSKKPPAKTQEDWAQQLAKPGLSWAADLATQDWTKERKISSKSLAENCNKKNSRFFVGFDSDGVYVWDREVQVDSRNSLLWSKTESKFDSYQARFVKAYIKPVQDLIEKQAAVKAYLEWISTHKDIIKPHASCQSPDNKFNDLTERQQETESKRKQGLEAILLDSERKIIGNLAATERLRQSPPAVILPPHVQNGHKAACVLKENGIHSLWHFTDFRNIKSIRDAAELRSGNAVSHPHFLSNEISRNCDQNLGRSNYVRLSFIPNSWFFHRAKKIFPSTRLAWLRFNLETLTSKGILYSSENAASAASQLVSDISLLSIDWSVVNNFDDRKRGDNGPTEYKTCYSPNLDQKKAMNAEILILAPLSLEFCTGAFDAITGNRINFEY